MVTEALLLETIEYPDSDGEPMSDNSEQLDLIMLIKGELEAIYKAAADVVVHGDLLWYPVKGRPDIRRAPDTMVIFGRPKSYRGSYKQWVESDIPPQVVFEIISPANTPTEMRQKLKFYNKYGVEEYYEYDPQKGELRGWHRKAVNLRPLPKMNGWVSPRLKIRFELELGELKLFRPDGQPFRSHTELDIMAELERFRAAEERAEKELAQERAERERQRAERERSDKEIARLQLERERMDKEVTRQQLEQERQKAERLRAQLRAVGLDPDA